MEIKLGNIIKKIGPDYNAGGCLHMRLFLYKTSYRSYLMYICNCCEYLRINADLNNIYFQQNYIIWK